MFGLFLLPLLSADDIKIFKVNLVRTIMKTLKEIVKRLAPLVIATGIGASCLLSGCQEYRTEYSETKHEEAVVTSKKHMSEDDQLGTGLVLGTAMGDIGSGLCLGVAMSDDEHNYITFKGSNVVFKRDSKKLFRRFNLNDVTDVTYKRRYETTYDDINNDGKKEIVNRTSKGYKFLDAQLITNQTTRGTN